MSLSTDDLKQVVDYLKAHPGEWLPSHVFDLADRISNVESELKLQREVMIERFDAMDRRFEAMQEQMDERFTAADRRFEALQEQMDERFTAMQKQIDARFDATQRQMDDRFTALQKQMDVRFDQVDKRFEQQSRHSNRWMTAMMALIALIGVAMTVTNVIG
jgi:DNA anti-recombination protein RmuC